ncbi:MAG: glycine betaine ABC transporter substrate-binding protein [Verrucomicrobiota bacterium JB022]|nr:glycine betaine ABC transporter substrate-binding protein [Verrucomicrobiota bacterium JB022]
MKKLLLLLAASLGLGSLASAQIKIAYPNWAEGVAITHLVEAIVEDRMGYDVELTMADPGAIYAAVAQGQQDAFLDGWLPNTHEPYWEEYGDQLEDLGPFYGNGVTGLVVPTYMDVDSIEDLNDIADDLDGKIVGIGTGAGIYRNTNVAIDEYGLDLEQVASSGPAMTAALADAIRNEEPIVVTGWKPHWMFGRFDLKVLDDPRGVYPIDGLKKLVRKDFREEYPEVTQFLVNFSLSEDTLLDLMLAIDDAGNDDPSEVVRDWMLRHEPLIDSWMPR